MGLWSWMFPNEEERLRRVKKKMAAGDYENARKEVMRCKSDEAEKLYAECSAAIDKADKVDVKKALAKQGFHGWKLEISAKGKRRKEEVERLVTEELTKAGVDLDLPDLDEKAAKAAITRAQRRVVSGGKEPVSIRLTPVLDEKAKKALAEAAAANKQPRR